MEEDYYSRSIDSNRQGGRRNNNNKKKNLFFSIFYFYFEAIYWMRQYVLTLLLSAVLTVQCQLFAKTWLTTVDASTSLAIELLQQGDLPLLNGRRNFSDKVRSDGVDVTFDLQNRLQPIVGFGAGLPQASAFVLVELKKSSPSIYEQVLTELFSQANGAGLSILRFPIGSCDFSLTNTSYDEFSQDYSLEHFAVDADSEMIIEVLTDVRKIHPGLKIIASPWSAPSWLKVWNSLIAYSNANTLIDDDQVYETYANYLVRVTEIFADRGLPIDYMTLQNEPLFGDGSQYPGMYLDAQQAVRLGNLVAKKLMLSASQRIGKQMPITKLLTYDHNWDHPEYPQSVLESSAATTSSVFGVAWHCYGGDMTTALTAIRNRFPNIPQFLTECTGSFPNDVCDISQGMTGFGGNHEWDMRNLLLGAVGQGAQASVKWILALDEDCGPVLPDVTFRTGRPFVSIPSSVSSFSEIQWNQDYWSMRHLSAFLPTSSVRVAHRVLTEDRVHAAETRDYLIEGFVTDDSRTVTIIAMNLQHSSTLSLACSVLVEEGKTIDLNDELPPFSTKIFQFPY